VRSTAWTTHKMTSLKLNAFMLAAMFAATGLAPTAMAETPAVQSIFDHMAKLQPLVGAWKADIDFHERDGSIVREAADYAIKPVLDGTYLEWNVTVHLVADPRRVHSYMIMTTYNPDTGKYDQTYFYSRWAIRVTETGEFDDVAREFRTTAFIPREDGTHDESVHTVLRFEANRTIDYWHYSRYDNEKVEMMNLHAALSPSPR
jgi:hypothetical protein